MARLADVELAVSHLTDYLRDIPSSDRPVHTRSAEYVLRILRSLHQHSVQHTLPIQSSGSYAFLSIRISQPDTVVRGFVSRSRTAPRLLTSSAVSLAETALTDPSRDADGLFVWRFRLFPTPGWVLEEGGSAAAAVRALADLARVRGSASTGASSAGSFAASLAFADDFASPEREDDDGEGAGAQAAAPSGRPQLTEAERAKAILGMSAPTFGLARSPEPDRTADAGASGAQPSADDLAVVTTRSVLVGCKHTRRRAVRGQTAADCARCAQRMGSAASGIAREVCMTCGLTCVACATLSSVAAGPPADPLAAASGTNAPATQPASASASAAKAAGISAAGRAAPAGSASSVALASASAGAAQGAAAATAAAPPPAPDPRRLADALAYLDKTLGPMKSRSGRLRSEWSKTKERATVSGPPGRRQAPRPDSAAGAAAARRVAPPEQSTSCTSGLGADGFADDAADHVQSSTEKVVVRPYPSRSVRLRHRAARPKPDPGPATTRPPISVSRVGRSVRSRRRAAVAAPASPSPPSPPEVTRASPGPRGTLGRLAAFAGRVATHCREILPTIRLSGSAAALRPTDDPPTASAPVPPASGAELVTQVDSSALSGAPPATVTGGAYQDGHPPPVPANLNGRIDFRLDLPCTFRRQVAEPVGGYKEWLRAACEEEFRGRVAGGDKWEAGVLARVQAKIAIDRRLTLPGPDHLISLARRLFLQARTANPQAVDPKFQGPKFQKWAPIAQRRLAAQAQPMSPPLPTEDVPWPPARSPGDWGGLQTIADALGSTIEWEIPDPDPPEAGVPAVTAADMLQRELHRIMSGEFEVRTLEEAVAPPPHLIYIPSHASSEGGGPVTILSLIRGAAPPALPPFDPDPAAPLRPLRVFKTLHEASGRIGGHFNGVSVSLYPYGFKRAFRGPPGIVVIFHETVAARVSRPVPAATFMTEVASLFVVYDLPAATRVFLYVDGNVRQEGLDCPFYPRVVNPIKSCCTSVTPAADPRAHIAPPTITTAGFRIPSVILRAMLQHRVKLFRYVEDESPPDAAMDLDWDTNLRRVYVARPSILCNTWDAAVRELLPAADRVVVAGGAAGAASAMADAAVVDPETIEVEFEDAGSAGGAAAGGAGSSSGNPTSEGAGGAAGSSGGSGDSGDAGGSGTGDVGDGSGGGSGDGDGGGDVGGISRLRQRPYPTKVLARRSDGDLPPLPETTDDPYLRVDYMFNPEDDLLGFRTVAKQALTGYPLHHSMSRPLHELEGPIRLVHKADFNHSFAWRIELKHNSSDRVASKLKNDILKVQEPKANDPWAFASEGGTIPVVLAVPRSRGTRTVMQYFCVRSCKAGEEVTVTYCSDAGKNRWARIFMCPELPSTVVQTFPSPIDPASLIAYVTKHHLASIRKVQGDSWSPTYENCRTYIFRFAAWIVAQYKRNPERYKQRVLRLKQPDAATSSSSSSSSSSEEEEDKDEEEKGGTKDEDPEDDDERSDPDDPRCTGKSGDFPDICEGRPAGFFTPKMLVARPVPFTSDLPGDEILAEAAEQSQTYLYGGLLVPPVGPLKRAVAVDIHCMSSMAWTVLVYLDRFAIDQYVLKGRINRGTGSRGGRSRPPFASSMTVSDLSEIASVVLRTPAGGGTLSITNAGGIILLGHQKSLSAYKAYANGIRSDIAALLVDPTTMPELPSALAASRGDGKGGGRKRKPPSGDWQPLVRWRMEAAAGAVDARALSGRPAPSAAPSATARPPVGRPGRTPHPVVSHNQKRMQERIARLTTIVTDHKETVSSQARTIGDREQTIAGLKEDITKKDDEINGLKETIRARQRTIDERDATIEALRKELEGQRKAKDAAEAESRQHAEALRRRDEHEAAVFRSHLPGLLAAGAAASRTSGASGKPGDRGSGGSGAWGYSPGDGRGSGGASGAGAGGGGGGGGQ